MKKVSTVGTKQSSNISQQRLTIGLDLGSSDLGRIAFRQRYDRGLVSNLQDLLLSQWASFPLLAGQQ